MEEQKEDDSDNDDVDNDDLTWVLRLRRKTMITI